MYGVEEIHSRTGKVSGYILTTRYKKQSAIEVREDGLYLEGIKGEETLVESCSRTRVARSLHRFNNDHSIVVED